MNHGETVNNTPQTNESQANEWESLTPNEKDEIIGTVFYVGEGLSLESEFKRITGEDWPGKKYCAEYDGASGTASDDDVYTPYVIKEKAEKGKKGQGDKKEQLEDETIDVIYEAPGMSLQDQFKELTGEDWPGKKYYAEHDGASGIESDDGVVTVWTVKKRVGKKGSSRNMSKNPKNIPEEDTTPKTEADLQDILEKMEKRGDDDSFAGERNINDETGKKRSRRLFDLYPPMKGESRDEYIARIHRMQELTAKFEAESQGKNEEEEKRKLEEEEKRKLEEEERQKKLKELEEIERILRTDDSLKQKGEQLEDEIIGVIYEAPGMPSLQDQFKELTGEDLPGKEYYIEHDGASGIESDDGVVTVWTVKKRVKRKEIIEEEDVSNDPLIAINADFTHDRKELARINAEQQLNAEKAGLFKRLWKKTLFKKYYHQKYTRQILEGDRSMIDQKTGEEVQLDELIENSSESAIKRFILGANEEMKSFIHKKFGEDLTDADEKTTEIVGSIIKKYASEWAKNNTDPNSLRSNKELKEKFDEEVRRALAEHRDNGDPLDRYLVQNYYEVAIQASERAAHVDSMDKVMEGFRVCNAEARNNIRTQAHRDNIDKLVDKIESSKIGRLIPVEIVAGVAGFIPAILRTGASIGAKYIIPVGGVAVSGVAAGLRERNRVTEDRTRMLQDAAVNLEYNGTSGEKGNGRHGKKQAKYEAKLGGTLYEMRPAKDLIDNLNKAKESGDRKKILQAIAEARVRIDFSDSEQKDIISYSSSEEMGNERLALDIAVISAERSLSEEDRKQLEVYKGTVKKEVSEDVDENDQDFRKIRTAQAMKQAGKTIAVGAVTWLASQELMATILPNKVSLIEKLGFKTNNNPDAQDTLLASLIKEKPTVGQHTWVSEVKGISGDDHAARSNLINDGYTETTVRPEWKELKISYQDIDPSKSTEKSAVKLIDWANNGTKASDGNELRLYLQNGQMVSGMKGISTTSGGDILNYDKLMAAGKVKGFLTIGGERFEVVPNAEGVWGDHGTFTTPGGATIKAIGKGGKKMFKYFEVAYVNDNNEMIPFATDTGVDSGWSMKQAVFETIEHPGVYDYAKTITSETVTDNVRDVSMAGVPFSAAPRVGLGATRGRNNESPDDNTPPSNTAEGGENPSDDNGNAQPGNNTENNSTGNDQSSQDNDTTGENNQTNQGENTDESNSEIAEINEQFGSLNRDMISIMTSEQPIGDISQQIINAWNNLTDDDKIKVANYELSNQNSQNKLGGALREWLRMNPQAIPNSAD